MKKNDPFKLSDAAKYFVSDDTAAVVCNNSAAILEESSPAQKIEFVWEIIDSNPGFQFPDYRGEKMTIQDCWRAYEKRSVQNAIRSILHKMNISVIELEENYEKTKFCDADLLEPCTEIEKKVRSQAICRKRRRHVPSDSQRKKRCLVSELLRTDEDRKVICYCMACLDRIKRGGKTAIHLLELIFPD